MLTPTHTLLNTFLGASAARSPATVIRSGRRHWSQQDRMIRYKVLYFTLGMDSQPLRRVSILAADKERHRNARFPMSGRVSQNDVTGFQRKRLSQIAVWHRRIQYQEYYIQHLMTRHVWGLLRMYPGGGVKMEKRSDLGYFSDDNHGTHRYTRQFLPAKPVEIYEKRKWSGSSS